MSAAADRDEATVTSNRSEPDKGSPDTERALDALEAERRRLLALELGKYLPWCLLTGAVLLGAIWLFVPAYVQFLSYSGLLVANALVVMWSSRLFRTEHVGLAGFLFAASFTVHLGGVPLILPETLLEMCVGYMLVGLLVGLVLGARHVVWVALFCVPALLVDILLGPAFRARFITPLPHETAQVISLVLMAFQMLLDAYVLYVVLGAQERLYRSAQQGAMSLADAQQQLLETNEELEQRVEQQVREIVARAEEIEALNIQLQAKVQERSRELVKALSALGRDAVEDVVPGTLFAERVKVERLLGRGGTGTVFLGRDLVTGRDVALKVMNPALGTDPKAVQRFLAEADASGTVSHPGVIRTLHVDVTSEGRVYQIMEYVDGVSLAQHLARGPLSGAEVARIGACVADALAAAHDAGIIHRDIKPGNLMLCRTDPGVRVLDFGISKIQRDGPENASLTVSVGFMGTPQYMSPEQIRSTATVTAATDVYSLGIVLFQCISGDPPFRGTMLELCTAHVTEAPPDLRAIVPGVRVELAELIAACIDKDPPRRPSARELTRALSAIADSLGAPPGPDILPRYDNVPTLVQ